MRGAPQVGFSATMRKMRSRNSLLTHFLPTRVRCRESQVQYSLNPARCQRTTLFGWTRISACFQSGQSRRKITQNNLSGAANHGCGRFRFKMTRLSCHRFRPNEVRLWLSVIAYNLGNLWRRLVLPKRIDHWSLTSLQQRLVKTGGRLIKHARYYWLLLAESHLTRRVFGAILRRIWALPLPTGETLAACRGERRGTTKKGGR